VAVLDELLVRLGVDMSEAQGEVDEGAQGIENRLNGLSAAGGLAAAGLAGAFAMGLESAMDISSVETKLQNQLDLTDEQASAAGHIAGDVYAAGFGESLDAVGEAFSAVESSMQELGSVSDAEMQQLTKSALGLSETFNFDVTTAAAGAGNMIKAGLAKDGTEAMDLLAAAAQQLPSSMREELPDVMKEYSEFFGQLGFTGPQMMGLLAEAAKNPTFELDKMGDALKEFSLQMADTAKVSAPLKELGLDVDHIQKLMNTGQGTKAFDEVNGALLKVEDQTKRTALQAALFGGPGEDIGNTLQAIAEAGGAAGSSMTGVAGSAKEITDNMAASPAQQWDSVMRTVTETLGVALLPVLKLVSDLLAKHPGLVQALVPIVLALAAGLAIAAAAQWAMNSAMLASPITWIILGVAAIVGAILLIATQTDLFQKAWALAWGAIKSAASAVANWFTGTVLPALTTAWNAIKGAALAVGNWFTGTLLPKITGVWNAIATGASDMWTKIKGYWNAMVSFITGIPGRISSAVAGMWNGIPAAFRSAINSVIGGWNRLSFSVGGGSFMGADIPSFTLNTPNIPYLADGGITTGPTLAMIGEGREQEAVLPLSRLEQLINQPMSAAALRNIAPAETRVTLAFEGATDKFVAFLQDVTRTQGGGSIVQLAEG